MDYRWNWRVFLESASGTQTYLDWLLAGLGVTVALGLSAWVLALLIGTIFGVMRTWPNRFVATIAATWVELFRNVPLLVQLFIWYFAMPDLLPYGDRMKQASPPVQQFVAAALCLGTYTSARICEQVRAGIESLQRGQKNAGLAIGLTLGQTYRHVLLPQALRLIVPPLTSEFLSIFKNSAVASTIGLLDLASQGRQLVDYTAQPYEAFIAVTVLYLAINATVMTGMRWVEARTARRPA